MRHSHKNKQTATVRFTFNGWYGLYSDDEIREYIDDMWRHANMPISTHMDIIEIEGEENE